MQRYFLRLSFKGTQYAGWQVQDNAVTVQGLLNQAIAVLTRHPVETTGCGRTDTGVHASQFYVHFDSPDEIDPFDSFLFRLNALLPTDISVHELIPVERDAHARYDATERRYEYHITTVKNPFLQDYTLFHYGKLDIEKMNRACSILLKHHDFSAFSKSNTQTKTNNCQIRYAIWEERNNQYVFVISADRFLRGMVRAIVGTMLDVGSGKTDPRELDDILASRNRSEAGRSVPAQGLFLTGISYPYIPNTSPVTIKI